MKLIQMLYGLSIPRLPYVLLQRLELKRWASAMETSCQRQSTGSIKCKIPIAHGTFESRSSDKL